MKKLMTDKDYVCIAGHPADISSTLNKIGSLYDFKVLSTAIDGPKIVCIVERRKREHKI